MKRTSMAMAGAGIMGVVLLAVLIARWQAVGFSLVTTVTSLLVILGLPAILWLWLDRGPVVARRSMPRWVWIGLGLVVLGAGGLTTGIAATSSSTQTITVISGSPATAIHPVAVPQSAARDLDLAFPGFAPVKAWGNGHGVFEIWLRRRSRPGYALQVTWIPGKGMQVQNQEFNTLYRPGSGKPMPLSRLRNAVNVANSEGPFVFPGYAVYIVPTQGTEVVVSRATGMLETEESW